MIITVAIIAVLAALSMATIVLALRGRANALFLSLVALTLLLVGVAVAKDTQQRDYLAIQEQYKQDYPSDSPPLDVKVQQQFPQFVGAKRGDNFRVERCISCHVPNIQALPPEVAAQRLACDFFKYYTPEEKTYAPGDKSSLDQFVKANGLKSTGGSATFPCFSAHPTKIDAGYYAKYGPGAQAANGMGVPLTDPTTKQPVAAGGFLPTNVDPGNPANPALSLDAIGCVVCHNGNRLALTESEAHTNLIVNPVYSWSQGAALYYQQCVSCHGGNGLGGGGQGGQPIGPPLNNQDRLGYFNEDYYYRCIEYGNTGFEHIGSAMPNWGSTASDFKKSDYPKTIVQKDHALSEEQIQLLIQFIRHWQSYDSTP